jgi:hypothetical protein
MPISEVLPGLFHWRARHPSTGSMADSYWLDGDGVLIDAVLPDEGVEWFAQRPTPPTAIVLSCRHHYRESDRFTEAFDCGPVYVPEAGMHDFADGTRPAVGYQPGAELPGGLLALEIGVLAPDDNALYLPRLKTLWFADSVVRSPDDPADAPLGFVPDSLMDDPSDTKRGILDAVGMILEHYEIENVLMAHGGVVIGDGAEKLRDLIESGGHTADL